MATKENLLKPAALALGTIILFASLSGRAYATTYSFTTIDVSGATSTSAYGINDSGQIVGTTNFSSHSFLDTAGSFTTIDVPGASSTSAFGINNSGEIVGSTRFRDPRSSILRASTRISLSAAAGSVPRPVV